MEKLNREELSKKLEQLTFYYRQLLDNHTDEELVEIIERLERDRLVIKNIFKLDIY